MSLVLGKHPVRLLGLVAAALAWPAVAQDVDAMLRDADRYRTGADNLQVDTLVQSYKTDGTLDKERRYTVFAQQDRRTLVLMQSAAEKGQKVLMLGDDFWLLMPGSARALRITPSQKLLGDASTGDIATLSWADDYTGTLVGDATCTDQRPCLHLSLQAARKGLSYQRIELWLGRQHHEPLAADLYVQSDKLAKRAVFVLDKPAAPTRVDAMLLTDELGGQKQTRVRYLSRQPREVPEQWLNPMFLARNPALE